MSCPSSRSTAKCHHSSISHAGFIRRGKSLPLYKVDVLISEAEHKPLSNVQDTDTIIANCRYPKAEKDVGTSDLCTRSIIRIRHWTRTVAGMT